MQQIRAITLDLDDTLWEIGPVIRRAEATLWHWLGEYYPRIHDDWTQDKLLQLRMDLVSDFPDKAHDFRFMRKLALAHVAVNAGYDEQLVEPAFEVFDEMRNKVELYPEVVPVLEWFAKHFPLVAITNGNANLHTIGIAQFFDDIVTSVSVGVAKPARPIFDEAIRRAGVAPENVLHVGDHPDTDVRGAQSAGMRTAWINRTAAPWPNHLGKPDATVSHIGEVRELLEPVVRARSA